MKEVPLQASLFADKLVDTRTRKQRTVARQASGQQQIEMFKQRDLAQFGVRARPQLPAVARNGQALGMVLEIEDPRTEEEKALARQKAAEDKTVPLFAEPKRDGSSRPLRLPEEMANTSHSGFGPDFHLYRSLYFSLLAMDGQL